MCPVCIASTAVMVAGAGSTGGILAVCLAKFQKFFRINRFGPRGSSVCHVQDLSYHHRS
jgi:hypothetical protein